MIMTRRAGIIGGSFNPPHNAHIELGIRARSFFNLDELIYIPTNIPSHKPVGDRWNAPTRSFMIKTALYCESPEDVRKNLTMIKPGKGINQFIGNYTEGYKIYHNESVSVSDIEIQNDQISFTIDTVKKLSDLKKDTDFHIIIGMDQALALDTWKNYIELSEIAVFCAAERAGFNSEEVRKRFPFIHIFPFPEMDISSSIIRQRLDEGRSIEDMVPPVIIELLALLAS